MRVRLCCPGEEVLELPDNHSEPLAEACRRTNYRYHMAISEHGGYTLCECVRCMDECEKLRGDRETYERCWWRCRCGPCGPNC